MRRWRERSSFRHLCGASPPIWRPLAPLDIAWLFGTHTLGLGSFRLLMTEDEANMLGDLSDLVATHLPLMFMDIGSVSITQPACSTERALHSTAGHSPQLLTTSTHYDSYDDIMHRKKPFTNMTTLVNNLCRRFAGSSQREPVGRRHPTGACAVDRTSSGQSTLAAVHTSTDGDLNRSTSTPLALCSFQARKI